MADNVLLDAFRHSLWANQKLLDFCCNLTDEQLRFVTRGTYGGILATFQHMIGAESYYRFLFAGDFLDWDWRDDELPSLSDLRLWSAELAGFWEANLAEGIDSDLLLVHQMEDGRVRRVRAGVVVAQALHHANVHREQVCACLTASGIEPPDLDVWEYGLASRRHSLGFESGTA